MSEADVKKTAPRKKRKKKGARGKAPAPPPRRPWWIAIIAGIGLGAVTAWAWPARPAPEGHVRQGNTYYADRRYREALTEYESAPGGGARNAGVHLDRGLARYRVTIPPPDGGGSLPMLPPDASAPEGLAQAQDEMRTAARGGSGGAAEDVDAFLRARAAYDLANTFFTLHQWDNAIEAYKEALRLRPGWNDAAWNLELARRLRELERNPPDAGQDASVDATPPDAQDSGNDVQDSGTDAQDSGDDGGNDGGMDGGSPDGGGRDSGAGDSGSGDSGGDAGSDGSAQPDGGDSGAEGQRDAGAPDAIPPRSMAPLDDLDRTSRSLQNELLRRRGMTPRSPDDDR